MLSKLLGLVKRNLEPIYLGICIILVGIIGYNVGRINTLRKGDSPPTQAEILTETNKPSVKDQAVQRSNIPTLQPTRTDWRVVVSKKSKSKVYHHTWCSGVKSIKEENKLWFETASAAQAAGYKLAGNCTE